MALINQGGTADMNLFVLDRMDSSVKDFLFLLSPTELTATKIYDLPIRRKLL